MASKVFGCEDLRREILSYIPKRCKQCKQTMGNIKYDVSRKLYRDYSWRVNECDKLEGFCNWCYYYVFEYN